MRRHRSECLLSFPTAGAVKVILEDSTPLALIVEDNSMGRPGALGMNEFKVPQHIERGSRPWRLWRTALAFVLAPPLGGALFGAVLALFLFGWQALIVGAVLGAAIGATAGIPLMGTFGLLFHWAARKRGWRRWWHYMLGGALGGIFGFVCVTFYNLVSPSPLAWPPPNTWIAVFEFVTGGTIVSGLAWLILRPDRD